MAPDHIPAGSGPIAEAPAALLVLSNNQRQNVNFFRLKAL